MAFGRVIGAVVLATAFVFGGQALAQQGNKAVLDKEERLKDMAYGLEKVCLPAQQARQSLSDFETTHRDELILTRMRVSNSTKVNMWGIGSGRDAVALLENPAGCTVSMSMWDDEARRVIPDLRGKLTGMADQYQVVAGDPESRAETLVVAFCARNSEGGVDSWYLYESVGEPQRISGQRRTQRQIFVSVVAPTEPFCAQE